MEQYEGAARRLMAVLFASQSMAAAAFIAAITVIPIVGVELSGRPELAGLPSTMMLIGAAVAAYPAGQLMQRFGRRPGLALGFLLGLIGLAIGAAAVVLVSFLLFLAGLLLVGFARGVTDQSRYAAADAVPLSRRARAISTVVFAGTVGAVGGPLLVGPLGRVAEGLGLPALAGPMLGGAVLFGLGGALVALMLRPDPRTLARALAADERAAAASSGAAPEAAARSFGELLGTALPRLALVAMVMGQAVMILVMSVTSLHMHNHDHGLGEISLVIGAHTLGMFGLSVVTGGLADRLGRPQIIALGALLLLVGALLAPLSLLTPWLALALFLVGLGWNFCYIGGSTLLADTIMPAERGPVQGASDLLINLASAGGSLGGGLILARLGYAPLCLLGAGLALLPLLLALPELGRGRARAPIGGAGPGD